MENVRLDAPQRQAYGMLPNGTPWHPPTAGPSLLQRLKLRANHLGGLRKADAASLVDAVDRAWARGQTKDALQLQALLLPKASLLDAPAAMRIGQRNMSAGQGAPAVAFLELAYAGGQLQKAEQLQTLAYAYLQRGQYRDSAATLERAFATSPNPATSVLLENELGCALLFRALVQNDGQAFTQLKQQALDAYGRARSNPAASRSAAIQTTIVQNQRVAGAVSFGPTYGAVGTYLRPKDVCAPTTVRGAIVASLEDNVRYITTIMLPQSQYINGTTTTSLQLMAMPATRRENVDAIGAISAVAG